MAVDPGPLLPDRRLREGVDLRAVLAEELEVERMRNLVLTALGDPRDPLQQVGQGGIGRRRQRRRRLGGRARCPKGRDRPRLRDRFRDCERQFGRTRRGLRDRHGAWRGHSPTEDVGQLLEVGCLGRGENCCGEDDRHEDQELLRAGGGQLERSRNGTAHGVGECRRRGLEAMESGGDGQEGGYRPDEVVEPDGFGLPLCRGATLGLLLGIIPFGAHRVQIPREGLQVAPRHGQLPSLGLILVMQLSVVGGVGCDIQVRDKRLPHLGGAGGGRPDGRGR